MRKTVWNEKEIVYGGGLTFDDFISQRQNVIITRGVAPVNAGAQATWAYKNMLTKDIGAPIYLAVITFPSQGGHDYHAHSGWEVIYILKGRLLLTYYSVEGEDVQVILEPGDVMFAPEGTPHSVWNVDDMCEFVVIKSPPFFLESLPLPDELRSKSFKPRKGGEAR